MSDFNQKAVAIITARGGSKRIPRKNIRDFCGEPIISYAIRAAIESKVFDHVMVSTDDEEIALIAKKYGAEIPFMRSIENADDFATTADVLYEVIDRYHEMNKCFEYACCIYPTAPFISPDKLKEAYTQLRNNEFADTVFTVAPYEVLPQRALNVDENGIIMPVYMDEYWKRTQDLQVYYHDCGQFYFFRTERFMETKCLEKNAIPLVLNNLETQDIDTEIDWKLAELKYELLNQG